MARASDYFLGGYLGARAFGNARADRRNAEHQARREYLEDDHRAWMEAVGQEQLDTLRRMEFRQWLHSPDGAEFKAWSTQAGPAHDDIANKEDQWQQAWTTGLRRLHPELDSDKGGFLAVLAVILLIPVILGLLLVLLLSGLTTLLNVLWILPFGGSYHSTFGTMNSSAAFWSSLALAVGSAAALWAIIVLPDRLWDRKAAKLTNGWYHHKPAWLVMDGVNIDAPGHLAALQNTMYTRAPVEWYPAVEFSVRVPPPGAPEEVHDLVRAWTQRGYRVEP